MSIALLLLEDDDDAASEVSAARDDASPVHARNRRKSLDMMSNYVSRIHASPSEPRKSNPNVSDA